MPDLLDAISTNDFSHAGLLFSRRARNLTETGWPQTHVEETCNVGVPRSYKTAFARWKGLVVNSGWDMFAAKTLSPIAIGLGNESPIEIGFTLHHTYGVPYLPAEAIKGLARRALALGDADSNFSDLHKKILFGFAEDAEGSRGFVNYSDGWLDPNAEPPLAPDITTVHHPQYYQGDGTPSDFDDPTPLPFVSIPIGTVFHFAVSCSEDATWAKAARDIILFGLRDLGIGAKTNVGYGRMEKHELT